MIPFSILSCRIYGKKYFEKEIRILDLSAEGFTFRLAEKLNQTLEKFILHFYDFQAGDYQSLELFDFRLTEEEQTDFYTVYRVTTDNLEYCRKVNHLMTEYLRYINLKSQEDDAELSSVLVHFPKEEVYPESLKSRKHQWFSRQNIAWNISVKSPWSAPFDLALSLDRPFVYQQYLRLPLSEFTKDFWLRNQLLNHPLAHRKVDWLYIGNQFCPLLFPDKTLLFRMLDKAVEQKLSVALVFPCIQESRLLSVEQLLKDAALWCRRNEKRLEIMVNDWGLLSLIRDEFYSCFSLTMGIFLLKRRKDVRMNYKKGFSKYKDQLSESSLQSSMYRRYLEEHFHIQRFSLESCGYPFQVIPGKSDLHLPFYQMNTSQFCPLYAKCRYKDRGHQVQVNQCPEYCKDWTFLYPQSLPMTGRYNSLFGYDEAILWDEDYLKSFLDQGVNRIVAEFL